MGLFPPLILCFCGKLKCVLAYSYPSCLSAPQLIEINLVFDLNAYPNKGKISMITMKPMPRGTFYESTSTIRVSHQHEAENCFVEKKIALLALMVVHC